MYFSSTLGTSQNEKASDSFANRNALSRKREKKLKSRNAWENISFQQTNCVQKRERKRKFDFSKERTIEKSQFMFRRHDLYLLLWLLPLLPRRCFSVFPSTSSPDSAAVVRASKQIPVFTLIYIFIPFHFGRCVTVLLLCTASNSRFVSSFSSLAASLAPSNWIIFACLLSFKSSQHAIRSFYTFGLHPNGERVFSFFAS